MAEPSPWLGSCPTKFFTWKQFKNIESGQSQEARVNEGDTFRPDQDRPGVEAAPDTDGAVSLHELENSLGFLLRISQVRAYERFYAAFDEIGLRPGEFSVMWVILRNPGVRQGLLAETLGIKPAQMTKMIRRLEVQDRIRRVIPDDDRRSVRLYLTEGGEAFVRDHRDAFFGHDDYHNHGLSEAECRQLAHLLRRYSGVGRRADD
ncbi:MarR family transcriptional regulator [Mameliella alba]|nr:MarR family transcriptional regulator [Mameliella alba]